MSVTAVPLQPLKRGSLAKLWLVIIVLIVAAVLIAAAGAGQMRGETTQSGLVIRTVERGEGDLIGANDGVMIEYEGRLTDGTVFDSSEGRGPTPMLVGQVIPGFSEALQKMRKGGRYRIRIPSELAYGATPPPGGVIPANADLDFDVHVVQVIPNAAQMMGPAG